MSRRTKYALTLATGFALGFMANSAIGAWLYMDNSELPPRYR